jgi:hypothetical protein
MKIELLGFQLLGKLRGSSSEREFECLALYRWLRLVFVTPLVKVQLFLQLCSAVMGFGSRPARRGDG